MPASTSATSSADPSSGGVWQGHQEKLETFAGQAAVVMHNGRLAAELRDRVDEIQLQATELAASRSRIVAAHDTARRRIERDIHDGAQQDLVALIARIGLARAQTARQPGMPAETLDDLEAEARGALENLRQLAAGIHPTELADHGLFEAIESRTARLPIEVAVECEPELREARFGQEVEGAAYFFVAEAVANAMKHAGGARVVVRMSRSRRPARDRGRRRRGRFRHRRAAGVRASRAGGPHGGDRRRPVRGLRTRPRHPADGATADREVDVTPGPAIRVVIADDHFIVREGVKRLLTESGEVEVIDAVGTAEELHASVTALLPDAVMTDIRMPPGHHLEGIEAAHRIRREHPDIGVVVLSQYAHESYAYALLKDGTAGLAYLLKDSVADLDQMVRALREVRAGGSMIDPRVVDALVSRKARRERSGLEILTPREQDVLHEMAQGKNNAGIAAALVLSESAVEKHVSSVLAKFGSPGEVGVDRRVTAVLRFLQGQ